MTTPARIAELRDALTGPAFLPGEPGYDDECTTYNLTTPLRPDIAVGAADVADVRTAVRFAAANGLTVAIRGGGHVVAAPAEGSVLINMRRMNAVTVDADALSVRIEGAALWQDVLDAVTPHGLAPMNGSSPTVGAIGYLLGGGHSSNLGRLFGWAAEYVTAIEIVTADGEAQRITADSDPGLFFAVRGTKGNFGVVTAIETGVFPIERIFGGGLWFSGHDLLAVLNGWREWVAGVPDEMSSSIAVQRLPADPALPEPLRAMFVLHVRIAYVGAPDEGARLIEPLRKLAPIILETVADRPYAEASTIHQDPPSPLPYFDRSIGLRELTAATVDALDEVAGPDSGCTLVSIEIRALGGALDRAPLSPDAIPARGLPFQVFGFGVGPLETAEANRAALARVIDRLRPWADERRMVSFLSPDEAGTQDEIRALYGRDRYLRLARLKRIYDPANIFRVNHNIAPG